MQQSRRSGAILGHSFVHRLASAIKAQHGTDMTVREAAPIYFRVDDIYDSIIVEGISGGKIGDLIYSINKLPQGLDVVMLNVGSNDMCVLANDPQSAADKLLSLGNYLQCSYKVKLVIFCSIIPRDRCREVSRGMCMDRAEQFNRVLFEKCAGHEGRMYLSFKGFWRDTDKISPLPVSAWSADGIHPGPAVNSAGFRKYWRNIRRGLLAAPAELQRMQSDDH